MKIVFYNVRYDEQDFILSFAKKHQIDATLCYQSLGPDTFEYLKGQDGVSVVTSKIDRSMIEKIKENNIQFLSTRTIGYDHIDIQACHDLGIKVSNVTYNSYSVAEYTLMMMLMGLRKIPSLMQRFQGQDFGLYTARGKQLKDLTVGIIGTGKIGQTVIDLLTPFHCTILGYDAYHNPSLKDKITYCSLEELYCQADLISLHAPNTEETYHMLDTKAFDNMKDGVGIVNTARGSLIDTQALINAIESKKVGFACLDVLENETNIYYKDMKNQVINHRELAILRSFPNVLLTPHTAFYSQEAVTDMIDNSIYSLLQMYQGKENPWLIK